MTVELNEGQTTALHEILTAFTTGETRHVLTGHAGTGKTTLMQAVVRELIDRKVSICVTAPTHKAVSVLAKKLRDAGLGRVSAMTIHSLLGLRPAPEGERTILKRGGKSQSWLFRAVVIDEASMVSSDLHDFIDNDLKQNFVLFVGDPAQLPPVEEDEARCFGVRGRSNLPSIVRQAAGNPIIQAAQMIRDGQSGKPQWEWTEPAENGPHGVYRAGNDADEWMRDAFTSDEFRADNDAFRYIAYTNARVAAVNARVRGWIYGITPTPFVIGERAICRTPVINDEGLVFSVNEEVTIAGITAAVHQFDFPPHEASGGNRQVEGWSVSLPVWRVEYAERGDVSSVIARDPRQLQSIESRLVREAKENRSRWYDRFQAKEAVTVLQHVYAMTAHTSQGSTFANVFVDVADIRKAEFHKPKECQQLAYVAVTRASHAVVLIGVS